MKANAGNILELLSSNPSDFSVVAVGDKKRYHANKILLGDKCRYEKNIQKINNKNTDIVVICGELAMCEIKDIPMIHISQLINYKAKKFWDSKKEYIGVDLNHHGSNPYVVEYLKKYRKVTAAGIIEKYFYKNKQRKLKMLSIGCGCGHIERNLLSTGFFSEIHGCDISSDSIEVAKEKAKEIDKDGIISYFVHDANSDDWKDKYDVIIAFSCVHHIERLEFFLENVKKALNPNGIFIQVEYTGAARFQHSCILIGVVNLLLCLLPKKFKRKSIYRRIGFQEVLCDPSEAVRSDEIIPLTKIYFPNTKVWKNHSIVLHLLYQCVNADKFHTNKSLSTRLSFLTLTTERLFSLLGLLKPANAILVSEAEK